MVHTRSLVRGVRDGLPIVPGIIPFAMIVGAVGTQIGMSPSQIVVMSVFVIDGAAQLTAIELMSANAPTVVVIVTGLIVVLRYAMYSASLAPYFGTYSTPKQWFSAFLITDPSYALSITEYEESEVEHFSYYVGVGVLIWVSWSLSTAVGVVVGEWIPEGLRLEFIIPLVFLALVFPTITDTPTGVAAVVGAITATLAHPIPYNAGLILAASVGVVAGTITEHRWH
jgi:4-azaleucine resistance transporter AzlC